MNDSSDQLIMSVLVNKKGKSPFYKEIKIHNWNGLAIYSSKENIEEQKIHEKWKFKKALYFLIGEEIEDKSIKRRIYVGQTDNLLDRFSDHKNKKPFWSKILIITDSNELLNSSQLSFFERIIFDALKESDYFILENTLVPHNPTISEHDRISAQQFLEKLKIIFDLLDLPILIQN